MFVISRGGHMGFWWEGERPAFIEEGSMIFSSRADCLEYLKKIHGKERAVEIIVSIKKSAGKSILSF